ncbi:hypothetical protein CVT26_014158 [Gymnopilus dilepis]|uniref:Utp8 beta-propeller domain-containing protein n=1 Tax=Gymnopilus dilepis TaxID=231916 RepID=A0A409VUG1_9AGAR|nr:hypothetical protein CVT26_014158 [Gymnopilus dilepis]
MSNSNINDIFVLSSYTSSARGKAAAKYTPGVYASSSKSAKSSDGFVTVAVQADGVHVLDVSALHPVISHTLGPSTSFTCAPLTLPSSSKTSRTYAAISSSPELSLAEEAGRTIWMWQDDTSNSKQKEKRRNVIFSEGEKAYALYACEDLPERILAVSNTGSVTVMDANTLEVKATSDSNQSTVIHTSLFPASTCSFSSSSKGGALVMVSSGSSENTRLRIFAIDEADSISLTEENEISVDSEESISSVSCSRTGVLSILTTEGLWHSYQLTPELSSPPDQFSSPLQLSGFSFLSEPSKLSVSLLALTSSHVLLAAIASQEITLLLWDLQFSVLLASHTFSIPSALSSSSLHIRLVPGVDNATKSGSQVVGQAILVLSSVPSKEKSDGGKTVSILVVVPYTVAAMSTIAAAMGRGDAGKKWLHAREEKKLSADEKTRQKLLDTMQSAMQSGRPQTASAAFLKWAPKTDESAAEQLSYNFTKDVLRTVLGLPTESKSTSITASGSSYAPEVVRYLLERRVVCSSMLPPSIGLLGALRAKNDWATIELAFTTVLDLTESEIVECLLAVVRHSRSLASDPAPNSEDAMQVDSIAATPDSSVGIPPLISFLNLLASYPTSRGPLVVAFRKYMHDAEDLTAVLQVLDGWLARRVRMDERLLPSKKDLKKNEQGVWIVVGRKGDKDKTTDVPPLEKMSDILQVVLDACFLSLLQHPPSHKILRKLQEKLTPEISFSANVETLRGFLEPFAIAQEKAIKESLVSPEEREREKQKVDWRQRRKGMDVGADIGLYRLEELVL